MIADSNQSFRQRHLMFHCGDCGSDTGYRSRPRNFSERYMLPILFLRPARCAECFRRDYRLIFTNVRERMPAEPAKPPASLRPSEEARHVA